MTDENKIQDGDEVRPVNSHSESVVKEKSKQLDIKLIGLIGVVVIIVLAIMFSSGHKKEENKPVDKSLELDKNAAQQALTANMKAYEQQQLYRHRKQLRPAPGQSNVVSANRQTSVVEEMQPQVQTRPSSLPRDCTLSGITNKNSCKAFLARNSAPSTIFESHSASKQSAASVNTADESTTATFVGKDANSRFANQSATTETVTAHKIAHPSFTIASGELVPAVLESAVNSDLPGMVRAVTSRPVYSYTGARVLIPAGSRLIGQYSSGVIQTQRRVFVMWNRVVLPNGTAVDINSPGTDRLGTAGQGADSYETHFWSRFGQATLLSILGAGVATAGVGTGDEYNSASQYRSDIAQNLQDAAQSSLNSTVANAPTLHLFQGAKINVFIAHDLNFYGIYHSEGAV